MRAFSGYYTCLPFQAHASELEELEATYRAKITAEMERYDALVKVRIVACSLPPLQLLCSLQIICLRLLDLNTALL